MTEPIDIPLTAEFVVETIEAMFTIIPYSGHAPELFPCRECGEWQALALARVRAGGDEVEMLTELHAALPNPQYHPNENCIPCYGCRWEQQYAVDLIREVLNG